VSGARASRHLRAGDRSSTGDGQRGSVTIVAAGLLVLSLALSLGVADLARVLVASARAQSAADSAALAAVQELALSGARDPADVATEYAARNGASLVNCSCQEGGLEATVEVRVPIGSLLLFADDRSVTSSARAEVNLGEASDWG
jgi:secretion/DNA translocation related TadE-like protein